MKNISAVNLLTAVIFLLFAASPVYAEPAVSALPSSPPASADKKVQLLGSEQKLVDRKMKVTADVHVTASGNVTLLIIGYDSTNRIIEIKKEDKYMYSGQTATLQLLLDSGDRIKKIDVQALEPIEASYQVLTTATIAHKDYLEAIIAVKNGSKAQAINVIAKGIDAKGRVVEVSGESSYTYEQRTALLSIKMDAVKEIDHMQFMALADDETYFIDQGSYMKDGFSVYTAVIKNGKQTQKIHGIITPLQADGSKLPALSIAENIYSNRLYSVRVPIRQAGAVQATAAFFDETKKNAIAKRGITIIVNGQELAVKQPPISVANTLYVPMRAIFEALGAQVDYKPEKGTVTAVNKKNEITLNFRTGTAAVKANDKVTVLPVKPQIIHNTTMVPVRFVSEALGAKVVWEPQTQTVSISNFEKNA
ncbi:stalk domain-containing protein [Paenibacillus sp. GCM10027626]|uniref:stalk domain-containing protein n=1 Tax=Paenibacillus sp. GCM10027626 TaxID=3273411 RepID=UPI00362897D5